MHSQGITASCFQCVLEEFLSMSFLFRKHSYQSSEGGHQQVNIATSQIPLSSASPY